MTQQRAQRWVGSALSADQEAPHAPPASYYGRADGFPGPASAGRTGRAIVAWLGLPLFGRGHSGYRPSHSAQTAVFGTPPQPAVRR